MSKASHSNLFSTYIALGPRRSYDRVAQVTGVSRRTVADVATRENWQERLHRIERSIAVNAESEATETIEQMHARHSRIMRAVQARGLEAIKSERLSSSVAVRAIVSAVREERESRIVPSVAGAEEEARDVARMIREFVREADERTMGGFADDEEYYADDGPFERDAEDERP